MGMAGLCSRPRSAAGLIPIARGGRYQPAESGRSGRRGSRRFGRVRSDRAPEPRRRYRIGLDPAQGVADRTGQACGTESIAWAQPEFAMPPVTLASAVNLARAQFALTVVWHVLFPAFTIRPLASPG